MDNEESFRRVAADSMAQGFIMEYLFRQAWLKLPKHEREAEAKKLLENSNRTEHFAGATRGDEAASEQFADVVSRFPEVVDKYVGRTLAFCQIQEERSEGGGG